MDEVRMWGGLEVAAAHVVSATHVVSAAVIVVLPVIILYLLSVSNKNHRKGD